MSRFLLMFTLIVAGEINFGLPFHIARFFRPTYLDVFGFTNTQLGDLFAAYGVAAMLAYFPGGAAGGSIFGANASDGFTFFLRQPVAW